MIALGRMGRLLRGMLRNESSDGCAVCRDRPTLDVAQCNRCGNPKAPIVSADNLDDDEQTTTRERNEKGQFQ